jgi:lipoprotein-releasing system permease protein
MLSKVIADKLEITIGDDVMVHFFQKPPRFRKLKLVGIYETNLSEYFDSRIIIGDIKMLQRLNGWSDSIAGGLQIYVKPNTDMEQAATTIGESMDYDLFIEKVADKYIQVFEWLALISRQVDILLAIILIVVCVNMVSVILILVMERTAMIGLLKAFGGKDRFIQSIFIYNGISLIVKGLAWGNLIGLGICLLQYQFHFFKLNAHDYYMSYVPIGWDWQIVVGLNILLFVVIALVLLLPTAWISKISPMKAIRFD